MADKKHRESIMHIAVPVRKGTDKGLMQSLGEIVLDEQHIVAVELAQDGSALFFTKGHPVPNDGWIEDGPIVCVEMGDIMNMVGEAFKGGRLGW